MASKSDHNVDNNYENYHNTENLLVEIDYNEEESSEIIFKQNFETLLLQYDDSHQGSKRSRWSSDRILEVIQQVRNFKDTSHPGRRASKDYYWINKYDVISEDNEDFLIFKRKNLSEPIIKILPREQYFDFLKEMHQSCDHGGRDKMIHKIKNKFYVPKKAIELYVSLCPYCVSKRTIPKKTTNRHNLASVDIIEDAQDTSLPLGSLVNENNAIASHDISKARARFDLIDFQSNPDGDYKWLLTYQSYATRHVNLRPLKTNEANEVALELTKIFLTFQVPHILDCDIGCDFTANVIEEIAVLLPTCHIIHGNCQAPDIERNDDSQDADNIRILLKDCVDWSVRCWFVQHHRNISLNKSLGKVPHNISSNLEEVGTSSFSNPGYPSEVFVKTEQQENTRNSLNDI